MEELKCPKCNSRAEMQVSFGGPEIFYGIYCTNKECGYDNRNKPSPGLSIHGLSDSCNFPPTNREQSIKEWTEKGE